MIYLTSDLHFNHNREFIYKARGFETIKEMNNTIVERYNSIVKPTDMVCILGDLCLGGGTEEILKENKELIESLNGTLYIIAGNHDTDKRIEMYESCKNVFDASLFANKIDYKKYHFYLSHYPTMTGNLDDKTLKQTLINLYGHTHQINNFYNDIPYMYHVGVDSHNCYPISIDEIIDDCQNKYKECIGQL